MINTHIFFAFILSFLTTSNYSVALAQTNPIDSFSIITNSYAQLGACRDSIRDLKVELYNNEATYKKDKKTTADSIAELQQVIATLKAEVAACEDYKILKKERDELERRNKTLETEKKIVEGEKEKVKKEYATYKQEMSGAEKKIAAIRDSIRLLNDTIAYQSEDVASCKKDLEKLRKKISELNDALSRVSIVVIEGAQDLITRGNPRDTAFYAQVKKYVKLLESIRSSENYPKEADSLYKKLADYDQILSILRVVEERFKADFDQNLVNSERLKLKDAKSKLSFQNPNLDMLIDQADRKLLSYCSCYKDAETMLKNFTTKPSWQNNQHLIDPRIDKMLIEPCSNVSISMGEFPFLAEVMSKYKTPQRIVTPLKSGIQCQ